MRNPVLLAVIALAGLASAHAQTSAPCVLHLAMDAHGRVSESRRRFTHRAFVHRLQTACAAAATPMQVFLTASPGAQYGTVKNLMDEVTQFGPPGTQVALTVPGTSPVR